MYRWATKFLIAVMLAPSIGPLAMPCAASTAGISLFTASANLSATGAATASSQPMHCHHALAGMSSAQAGGERSNATISGDQTISGSAIRSNGNCCETHCCCGAMTSEWPQPAVNALYFVSPFIESANIAKQITAISTDRSGPDSARAPPRG